ncbi:MAG: hypothetical protein NTZ02_00510 [Candidatus Woesearchaeota archaeon]|nr:hypothetical protein [Candidatus Woesearchaeota archaeon]
MFNLGDIIDDLLKERKVKNKPLEERVVTVENIKKDRHFSDSDLPVYEITTSSGTVALFEKDLSPRIKKIKPGDKLTYKTINWSVIVEIYDSGSNLLYKR